MNVLIAVKQPGGRWKVVGRTFDRPVEGWLSSLDRLADQDWIVQLAVECDDEYAISTSCKKAVQLYKRHFPEAADVATVARWNGRQWTLEEQQ